VKGNPRKSKTARQYRQRLPPVGLSAFSVPERMSGDDDASGVHLAQLEREKSRLETAVRHLETSNAELRSALAQGHDSDYEQAVCENTEVMARYRAMIAALAKEIAQLRGEQPSGTWL